MPYLCDTFVNDTVKYMPMYTQSGTLHLTLRTSSTYTHNSPGFVCEGHYEILSSCCWNAIKRALCC